MRPRRFDLIAFDWDGTLFDSTALIVQCIQASVRDVGCEPPPPHRAAHVIGLGLAHALQLAAPDVPPERIPRLVERYRHHYFARQHDVVLFDGVLPMLNQLRQRHHWLAVATGKSRQGLAAALESVELVSAFDATRTAEETRSKPDPLMLHELMREFGVAPERTLMVGDTSHDLDMAQHAGCAAVGVSYGAHSAEQLTACRPLWVADSVPELARWLQDEA